jgi:hypothetical protein
LPGDVGADAVEGEESGVDGSHEGLDELVEFGDLAGEPVVAAGQGA